MFLIGKLSPSQKKSTYSFLSISSLFSSSSIFLFTPLSVFFPLHPFFSRSYSFSLSPNGSNCIWPSRTAVANREPYITASPIYIYIVIHIYIHNVLWNHLYQLCVLTKQEAINKSVSKWFSYL